MSKKDTGLDEKEERAVKKIIKKVHKELRKRQAASSVINR